MSADRSAASGYMPPMEQDENEFASLLAFLRDVDAVYGLHSILEVGVFQGGTLVRFMDAFPYATVVGIDPRPIYRAPNVVLGCSQDPMVRQRACSLNDGRTFDFVFIDGDHSYDGVREDYAWATSEANLCVAVHDIRSVESCPDVVRFWNETYDDTTMQQFISDDTRNGIGVVWCKR